MTDLMGQVGLRQHATRPIGRIIEWATDSVTHHVVVHIGGGLCVSAERPVVRYRRVDEYPALVNSDFDLTDEQMITIARAAISMVGRKYNTAVIFVLLLHKLTGLPVPRWIVRWLERRPNTDCSQLADLALTAGGVDLFSQDSTLVTPADFQHALEAHERAHASV